MITLTTLYFFRLQSYNICNRFLPRMIYLPDRSSKGFLNAYIDDTAFEWRKEEKNSLQCLYPYLWAKLMLSSFNFGIFWKESYIYGKIYCQNPGDQKCFLVKNMPFKQIRTFAAFNASYEKNGTTPVCIYTRNRFSIVL